MQGQQASVRAFASSVLAQLNIGSAHSQAAMVMFNDVGTTTHEMSASRPDLISAIEEYGTKFRVSSGTNIRAGLRLAKAQLEGVLPTYERVALLLSDGEQSSRYGGASSAISAASELKAALAHYPWIIVQCAQSLWRVVRMRERALFEAAPHEEICMPLSREHVSTRRQPNLRPHDRLASGSLKELLVQSVSKARLA